MKQAFNIPSLPESVKASVTAGLISIEDAAQELYDANFLTSIDAAEARKFLMLPDAGTSPELPSLGIAVGDPENKAGAEKLLKFIKKASPDELVSLARVCGIIATSLLSIDGIMDKYKDRGHDWRESARRCYRNGAEWVSKVGSAKGLACAASNPDYSMQLSYGCYSLSSVLEKAAAYLRAGYFPEVNPAVR